MRLIVSTYAAHHSRCPSNAASRPRIVISFYDRLFRNHEAETDIMSLSKCTTLLNSLRDALNKSNNDSDKS